MQVPRARADGNGETAREPGLPDAFQRAARDGVRWADAEFALARAEAGLVLRRSAAGLAAGVAAFALLLAALVILSQAAVAALAPLLNGPALAGLAVGLGLLICVILSGLMARHLLSMRNARLASPVLRWFTGAAPQKTAAR
jgi:Putative Actinobacterial Holin-X, holin superfamily III